MKEAHGRTRSYLGALAVLAALWALAACSGPAVMVGHSDPPAEHSMKGPIPEDVTRRLPPGVFYILAGPDPYSTNLWEVSNSGHERELTHNRKPYGISSFGASPAGIVLSDAIGGVDVLARLGPKGPVLAPDGHVGLVQIRPDGEIAYDRPPYRGYGPYFEVVIKKNFWSPPHVIYKQKATLYVCSWGPNGEIAAISAANANDQGPYRLVVVQRDGRARTIHTGLGSMGNVKWSVNAPGMAISGASGSELLYPNGSIVHIPDGWHPAAWDSVGTKLLVWGVNYQSLGIWTPREPHQVDRIGSLPRSIFFSEVVWLARPARR